MQFAISPLKHAGECVCVTPCVCVYMWVTVVVPKNSLRKTDERNIKLLSNELDHLQLRLHG